MRNCAAAARGDCARRPTASDANGACLRDWFRPASPQRIAAKEPADAVPQAPVRHRGFGRSLLRRALHRYRRGAERSRPAPLCQRRVQGHQGAVFVLFSAREGNTGAGSSTTPIRWRPVPTSARSRSNSKWRWAISASRSIAAPIYVQTNNGGGVPRSRGRSGNRRPTGPMRRRRNICARWRARVYGPDYRGVWHRPWGYLFGGSGGAYQTVGAAENSEGIWDGFVPFVPGCDHAIPSMMSARMHALRELRRRDMFPVIADAYEPGGSGDPYAQLNEAEAAAFREITLLGHPRKGWYNHAAMDSGYFSNIAGMIPAIDPSLCRRFLVQARLSRRRSRCLDPPEPGAVRHRGDGGRSRPTGADRSGGAAGVRRQQCAPGDHRRRGGGGEPADRACASGPCRAGLASRSRKCWARSRRAIACGSTIRGRWRSKPITATSCRLRKAIMAGTSSAMPQGKPLYPQRAVLVGPFGTINAAGSMLEGRHSGKMLMLAVGLDIDAYCWQADWYRSQVRAAKGEGFGENFALYFTENSHHENPMTALQRTHAVSYGGALQQALRDLAAWVEEGVRPLEPAYRIVDTQLVLPASAAERGGIQPVIALTANGGARAEVAVGEHGAVRRDDRNAAGRGQGGFGRVGFRGHGRLSGQGGDWRSGGEGRACRPRTPMPARAPISPCCASPASARAMRRRPMAGCRTSPGCGWWWAEAYLTPAPSAASFAASSSSSSRAARSCAMAAAWRSFCSPGRR